MALSKLEEAFEKATEAMCFTLNKSKYTLNRIDKDYPDSGVRYRESTKAAIETFMKALDD